MPKTRGHSAKHQAARIDPPDVLRLLTSVYAHAPDHSKLWPFSAATLRKRFSSLLVGVGLHDKKVDGRKRFILGSLRPGGATHLLLTSESSELVRRRGRWVIRQKSWKCICKKCQEVLYTTYAEKLGWQTRARIIQLGGNFDRLLVLVTDFLDSAILPPTWWKLFQASDIEEHEEVGQ